MWQWSAEQSQCFLPMLCELDGPLLHPWRWAVRVCGRAQGCVPRNLECLLACM